MNVPVSRLAATLAALLLTTSTASAQVERQRGATLGGLGGAVVGGLIGDNNNEAGAGAAIGGVIGAVAGSILGDAADKEREIARQRYYQQQQQQQFHQQQQQVIAHQSAITLQDVLAMSGSGLSDSLIMTEIQNRGYGHKLQVADIIALHQRGVSENVISALQRAPAPGQPAVVNARPVIVEQPIIQHRVVPTPVIVNPRPSHHYRQPQYRSSRSRGSNIHFRF